MESELKYKVTGRGFHIIVREAYLEPHEETRVIQESSAIGDYDDSFSNPGSSFLWLGDKHHLNREEVAELIKAMSFWLETARLPLEKVESDE